MAEVGFAAAASQHPLTTQACGEVAGALLEEAGARPDLVIVFATTSHGGALPEIAATMTAALHPIAVVGCAAESVIGPHREVERGPAVVAMAAPVGPLRPVRLVLDGPDVRGWPGDLPFAASSLLLFADPFTFPLDAFLRWVAGHHPEVSVVGGAPSGSRGPGGSRLLVGTDVGASGAVGVLLGPSVELGAVASHGYRPVGMPLVVTAAAGNVITELAGRPALDSLVGQVAPDVVGSAVDGLRRGTLRLGRLVREGPDPPAPGDVLLRTVLHVDRVTGAMAIGDDIPAGTAVQFHLADPAGADADLRQALAGRQADAALVFTGTARGARLFPDRDHDVGLVHGALGPVPTIGFFTATELCPVHGSNARHTSSAAVAMLRAPSGT